MNFALGIFQNLSQEILDSVSYGFREETEMTRPHEIFREIVQIVNNTPKNVLSEIKGDSPKGYAASASLKLIRKIVLSIDTLDSKYDGSMKLMDPSMVKAGDSIDLGIEEETPEVSVEDLDPELLDILGDIRIQKGGHAFGNKKFQVSDPEVLDSFIGGSHPNPYLIGHI